MEVLFQVAEEYLYVPSRLVQVRNGSCRKAEVVGDKFHHVMVPTVVDRDAAYRLLVLPRGSRASKLDDFVNEHFGVRLVGQVTLLYALVEHVVAHSCDEENLAAVPNVQQFCVKISPVAHHDVTSLQFHLPCRGVVSTLAVRNVYIFR